MQRRIVYIITLLLMAQLAVSQTVGRYEYWVDNDYTGKTTGYGTQTDGTLNLSVDVSSLNVGAHFLYFRASNSSGQVSKVNQWLFFKSEDPAITSGLSGFEYWIDNDYAGRTRTSSSNTTQSFTVDVSDLAPGAHFLYFREANQAGIYGSIKSLLFYKSSDTDVVSGLSGYEYWIDNDYAGRTRTSSGNTTQSFMVDVSDLAPGVHFLYYREANQAGIYGQIRNLLFYKQFETEASYEITGYEYWIDNDYEGRTVSDMPPESPEYLFIDIDNLKQGLHQFNYRTLTSTGIPSGIKSWIFYIPDYENMDVEDDSPLVGYRFNFNYVSEYVEIPEDDDYEMRDFTFDIPELTSMASVDDNCSFTFNTENDSVMMYRTTQVGFGLQFKKKSGLWSAPVTYAYEENDTIRRKAVPLALQQTVTFDKRNRGDFDVFRIKVETPGKYYLSASQSCRILLYSTKDGSLYNTIEPSDVTSPYMIPMMSKGASYYGVVTDEVTDDANGADVISVRFMQNLNFVPSPEISYSDEKVTISCDKSDATIYYTLDGTDPTESSPVYTAPFEFKHNGVIKAVAKSEGLADSYIVVQKISSYTVQKPVITFQNLMVYISTATENARIYYTTNGADPLTEGTLYSGPFSLSENSTVRAVALRDNYNASSTASQLIDITSVKCVAPTFSVKDSMLTIATLTEGASIWYTMDGSQPTEQSLRYTGPVKLEMNGKIRAFVTKSGAISSSESEFTVDWFRLEPPVISFSEQTGLVTLTAARSEAVMYYIIGGGVPTIESNLYKEPFLLDHNDTIIAFGICEHFNDSRPDTLVVDSYKVAAPQVNRVNGKMELTCATEGAEIRYTIDGTDPLTNGTVYSEPVVIDVICTMKVIALKAGFHNSDAVSYDLGKCSAPTFECVDNVLTIAVTTADAAIRYTLDGSMPDNESTLYSNPIRLERNVKVSAIAVKAGMVDSDVSDYVVDWFTVEKPEFAFTEGILAVTCATPGSTIRYEIGGAEPDTASAVYTAPIVLTDNKVVKAYAVKADFNDSEVGSYTPDYFTCDAPVISRVNGQMVMSCTTEGVEIRYTTNGTDPLTDGVVYSEPLNIDKVGIIKAIAVKDYFNNSTVTVYDLNMCVAPQFSCSDNILTISTATEGASIYYTLDGSVPGPESLLYSAPVKLEHNQKVRAYAVKDDMVDSEVADYTVDWFTVAKPEFAFTEGILAITCSTPGSVIRYEIGGAAPDTTSAVYSVPIALTDNRVVKVYAVKTDFNDSEVGVYEPAFFKCAAPEISFDGHKVTISSTTENSSIYFTLNGKVPDKSSELYAGARLLDGLCTVKAYTVRDNFIDSECSEYILPSYYNGDAVYISEPGAISKAFEWCGTEGLVELSVQGSANAQDFSYIRGIRGLKFLDMTKASVDSLPTGALSGTDIVSFSTPAGLKKVGRNVLKDCEAIAAVQWNSDLMVPDDLLGGAQKSNMLLYVKSGSYVRAGAFTNVIVNGIADQLTLTDSETSDFWCPVAFTARKATYTHTYTMQTVKGQCTGWESIALPFTVASITHAKNGAMAPFGAAGDDDKPFWLEKLTGSGFVPADKIEANTPYIICMPNNEIYADKYILAGEVTFQATNVIVEATSDIKVSTYGNVEYVPNYSNGTSNGRRELNVGTEYQGHKQGSLFVPDLRRLKPFEAYVAPGSSMILIRDLLDSTTGINDIFTGADSGLNKRGVYDLKGRKLSDDPDYRPSATDVPAILIIDGRKTVVR